jgi:hypothetical protein
VETVDELSGNHLYVRAKGNNLKIKVSGVLRSDDARIVNGEPIPEAKITMCSDDRTSVSFNLSTIGVRARRNEDHTQHAEITDLLARNGRDEINAHWKKASVKIPLLQVNAKLHTFGSAIISLPTGPTGVRVDFGARSYCMEFPNVENTGKKTISNSGAQPVDCEAATLHCPTEIIEP